MKFLTEQMLIVPPPLLFALLGAVGAVLLRREKTDAERYALSLFLPTFGFYFLLSFNEAAKGNWTVTAYPAAILLSVVFWPNWPGAAPWPAGSGACRSPWRWRPPSCSTATPRRS